MREDEMKSLHHPSHAIIPSPRDLEAFLDLESTSTHYGVFDTTLLGPLNDFLAGSGKKFRSELIEIGFLYANGKLDCEQTKRLEIASQIIEAIHTGSMIIDDIQDQSEIRRGKPTLHCKHGIALALNAGNWLYFQALQQIETLNLNPIQELNLRRYCNRIFLKAHFGQAVDVGTPMSLLPQSDVRSVCFTSMELKTGALMALSFDIGAFLADPVQLPMPEGSRFARNFGIALQMFDDVGNFYSPPPKGKEDIRNGRPSFIWSVASQLANEKDYARFIHGAQMLPNESFISSWAELFDLKLEAKNQASKYLWNILEQIQFSSSLQDRVKNLFMKLENSYV